MIRSAAPVSPQQDTRTIDPANAVLRRLTAAQLQQLGVSQLAYVKAYRVRDRGLVYVTHGADGSAIAMADHAEAASQHAAQRDLRLVSLH